MSRSNISKETRKAILEQMDDIGEITTEKVVELIRPYYMFDIRKLRNQALHKAASGIMRSYKDKKGRKACYGYKDKEGKFVYVDIDKVNDLNILKHIELQLSKRYRSLNVSKKKIKLREQTLLDGAEFKEVNGGN